MKLLILTLLFCGNAAADSVPKEKLMAAISDASTKYGVRPKVLQAISYLESSGGKRSGVNYNSNGTYDVGSFQINSIHMDTTCKKYNVYTVEGNAMCAAKLLSIAKRHCKSDPHCLGRYHSKTKSKKINYSKKLNAAISAIYPPSL